MLLPLALFAVAAIAGLIMAVRIFAGAKAPLALSLLHAAFGAAGIVTLYLAIQGSAMTGLTWIALGLFVIAALGGFFAASFRYRGALPPKALIALHALLAISAFGLLAGVYLELI